MTEVILGPRKAIRPANVPKIRPMEVIRFVRKTIKDSTELARMCERVDFDEGRPRRLRVDVLLAASVAHAVTQESNMQVRGVAALLRALPVPEQRVLDIRWVDPNGGGERLITERQVEYLFGRLAHAFTPEDQHHNHLFALDEDVWRPDGEWLGPLEAMPAEDRHQLLCDPSCPVFVSMEFLGNMLLSRFWDEIGLPDSPRWAVDSAVLETHFATKSWGPLANIDPENVPDDDRHLVERPEEVTASGQFKSKPAGGKSPNQRTRKHAMALTGQDGEQAPRDPRSRAPEPAGPVAQGKFTRYSPNFPQVSPRGYLAHTKDTGASNVYQGAGNSRPKAIRNGRDKHVLVASGPLPDGSSFPPLVRAYRIATAEERKWQAFLDLLEMAELTGASPAIVTADRIYSAAKAENLQRKIDESDWTLVRDLKKDQRRLRQWTTGAHYVDGWWFTSGMPEGLVDLPRVPQNTPREARLEIQARFDHRSAFAFRRNSTLRDGGFRLRGPAIPDRVTRDPITGRPTSIRGVRVRCVNSDLFHFLPRTLPKTACVKGQQCGCSLTFTVHAHEIPNSCEPTLWGTSKWAAEYYRRNMSEAAFSNEQYSYGLDRHSIRVRARKWDLAHAIVTLASFIRLVHSLVMRLGAWTLDPGYYSALDENVYRPAIGRLLEPSAPTGTKAPPG